jgi:ABC-type nitrate/sulfonate/bicarbonate transport system substrate-binding protein
MEGNRISRRKALSLLGGSALAAALPGGLARAQGAPLRFGIQTTIWGAVAIIAEVEKLFEKAGANVEVVKFGSGAQARDAMIAGHIDIVSIGSPPFILGVPKVDLVAIGISCYAGGTLALVASKKSGIKTVPDLRGKKIASQLATATDNGFQNKIMPAFGIKKDEYEVVNTKFAEHVSAMASGAVDAFAGVEPFPSIAEIEGLGTIITDYSKYDIVPVILATNQKVLASREADLVKFMRGWKMAADIFRNDPKRAATIVGNFFRGRGQKINDEVYRLAMSRMDVTTTYRPELKKYLTDLAQVLVKQKRLRAVPDIDRALDQRILKQIA